jgi:hypothetical protein
MAASVSRTKFQEMMIGSRILHRFYGHPSPACAIQATIDQACLKAAVANAVGCWEGYIEAVLREFVSKIRIHTNRRAWTLIVQYEALVDKIASDLNTPSWEKAREVILIVTGMDPYGSWIWSPKYSSQNDTKIFFDGVMKVRHAFAHGFPVAPDTPGMAIPGALDIAYVDDVFDCIDFFVSVTDGLLEHELVHRHACQSGWS